MKTKASKGSMETRNASIQLDVSAAELKKNQNERNYVDETSPDIRPKTKPKPKSVRKQKRRRSSSSSSDDDGMDPFIEEKLKQSALRNNLTHENVRNILQKVVRNDHVLAIVKLKEEELEKHEQARKLFKLNHNENDDDDDDDDDADESEKTAPKLTRAKAKALNKYPLPLAPFNNSTPDSDVVALIGEELKSDDDDEEYQPGDEDIESDDEINTTTSDIDSQPRTPQTQFNHMDLDDDGQPTAYTNDGLFKIPRGRNDSVQSEQEYIIAQRTRSKVSLAETPIEAIESTFKAPDIPIDMYDNIECEVDNDWIQFLSNFSMPLTSEIEKDEDTDPDYIAADKAPVDREELRHVNVSKKELNDLFNELYESLLDVDLDEGTVLVNTSSNSDNLKNVVKTSALTTSTKDTSSNTTTLCTFDTQSKTTDKSDNDMLPTTVSPTITVTRQSTIDQSSNCFYPSAMSTPARQTKLNESQTLSSTIFNGNSQIVDSMNASVLSLTETSSYTYQYPVNPVTFSPLKETPPILIPLIALNSTQSTSMFQSNMLQYSSILITMPTTSTTNTPHMSAIALNTASNSDPIVCLNRQIEIGKMKRDGVRSKRSRFKSALYNDLENLNPNSVVTQTYLPHAKGFTLNQRQILEQQLRMHVQLSTQNYIQTYGHPEFYTHAYKFKRFLLDIEEIDDEKIESNQRKPVANLKPAIALIHDWQNELSISSNENTEFIQFIQNEMEKLHKNLNYKMLFHSRLLHKMCHSKVFIYPQLLPKIPFRFQTKKLSEYIPSEDYLLAFSLERYFTELRQKTESYKLAKPKEVSLMDVCRHISSNFLYARHAKSIYDYVRLRKTHMHRNPIKYYFEHKKAPPYKHRVENFDENCIIEPIKRPLPELSTQWANFVETHIGHEHDNLLKQYVQNPIAEQKLRTSCVTVPTNSNKSTISSVLKINANKSSIELDDTISFELIYKNSEKYCPTISNVSQINQTICCRCLNINGNSDGSTVCLQQACSKNNAIQLHDRHYDKGQKLLTSYFSVLKEPLTEYNAIECESVCEKNVNENNKKIKSVNWSKRIIKKYMRLASRKTFIRNQLKQKLCRTFCKSKKYLKKRFHFYKQNINLLFVNLCMQTYQKYTHCLMKMHGLNGGRRISNAMRPVSMVKTTATPIDVVVVKKRLQKIINNFNSSTDETHITNSTVTSSNPTPTPTPTSTNTHSITSTGDTKRLPKGNKSVDNIRLMLMFENQQEGSDKDFLFAQHYFDRVEETYITENNYQKFTEFFNILRCFDDSKENCGDLYLKLEKLFGTDHPELTDIFLNFLLPSDATEIGKFMEHFIVTNMTKFINKLNIFYHKQPAQIRKILACLKELADEEDIKMEKIRSKVLPLLKGNQLLIDWFLQCLGNESLVIDNKKDDYETITFRKVTETIDDDNELYEHIPQSEILPDPNENPCHIRYMNGRIFYGNRLSFPTKLSFSVNSSCNNLSNGSTNIPTKSVDYTEITSKYRCVHDIKDFGDMKIRDKSRNPTEIDQMTGNSTTEEGEDSDDDQLCGNNTEKTYDKTTQSERNASTDILCDDLMLKAHAIRLNPSAHSSLFYSNTDLLNMLKPPDRSTDAEKETRLSPKKQSLSKSLASSHAKLLRKHSPNAKKSTNLYNRSPNKKNLSPSSATTSCHDHANNITSDSPAIQTAKKLKRILESTMSTDNISINDKEIKSVSMNGGSKRSNQIPANKIRKISKSATTAQTKTKPLKRASDREKNDTNDGKYDVCAATHKSLIMSSNPNRRITKASSEIERPMIVEKPIVTWSRDEDRLLLEQIKNGMDSNYEVITQIAQEFPNKTQENVRERINFLIDFLTKLRNKT